MTVKAMFDEFLKWAHSNNWNIAIAPERIPLPECISQRYVIPEQWLEFVSRLKTCCNASQTKWFLLPEDFQPCSDGFQWNEFELQSLSCAENDNTWKEEIISYWNEHLPIFMSVDSEYFYFAIDTTNGTVVSGYEPEFEESETIAESFLSFLKKVISGEIAL